RTIITAALTGVLATRDQCPAIPYTPREIGEEAARAAQEGAAIVHIHARTPEGGRDWSVETFAQIYTEVRARSDVIVNFSTGAVVVPAEQRIAHIRELKPEMAALNIGISLAQWPLVDAAITMGGNVRVGLEDNFYLEEGRMAKSNGELVAKAARMCKELGTEVASPADARKQLGLEPAPRPAPAMHRS